MAEKMGKDSRLLILLLVSLIIVGLVIFSNFLSFSKFQKVLENELKDQQLTETEHAIGRMENHILQARDKLITLSKFPQIEGLTKEKCTAAEEEVPEQPQGNTDTLLKTDENGDIVACSSARFSEFLGLNIKNKDYFRIPRDTREPYIKAVVSPGESPKVIIAVPLFKTTTYTPYPDFRGEFRGVLMTIIEIENLYNIYLHPYVQPGRNLFLLVNPETGETFLKSEGIADYAAIRDEFPPENGLNTIADFDGLGETIITAVNNVIGNEQFRLIIFTPLSLASADLASVQQRHLFSIIFIIFISIITIVSFISLYHSKQRVQTKLEQAEITLKKLGILSATEKGKYDAADMALEPRNIYLIKEDQENQAHELFIGCLNEGFAGLGIVRDDPHLLKKRYNLQKTSFIWMTKAKVDGAPAETNIDTLYHLIAQFVRESPKSVVLIDRIDYLFKENPPEKMIQSIHSLRDLAISNECIIIIALEPDLVDTAQLKVLETETTDLYGRQLMGRVDLAPRERDILVFINEGNTNNRLVSYKDITSKFRITKPTTRAKIRKLQQLGLLNIEQKGRFKSLKITSAGRRILG
ncbi:MAG: DUF835 domain-containing protein [DPANN group archaeon]|nr:DUF835 domain-containing protein [DPANN group archaeon]